MSGTSIGFGRTRAVMVMAAVMSAVASFMGAMHRAVVWARSAVHTLLVGALEPFEPRFAFGIDGAGVSSTNLFGISPALYQSNRHEAGVARRSADRHN